jgi:two-component system nitrogen regulation response regulator GlnG
MSDAQPAKAAALPDKSEAKILITDDNLMNRRLLAAVFESQGFQIRLAESGEEALKEIAAELPSVLLLDLRMPGMDGLEVLRKAKEVAPQLPVILLTAHGDLPDAVQAIKLGAYDFLARPINNDKLVLTVRRALERQQLMGEVQDLRRQLEAASSLGRFNTSGQAIRGIVHQIQQVAGSSLTVLIQGETGTGKELVARAIHQQSSRSAKPFVAIDCGAIPENLLESELFGYEKGAFSGADRRKEGYFQTAEGGSMFLDEVANLPVGTQAKLLRVIQERHVQPLGGTRSFPMNIRFIAAANEALDSQVSAGRFRQDLYYRLAEFIIVLPPLRERRDDILPLARRFQEEASVELRRPVQGISDAAAEILVNHNWPGNVRELRNLVRQAVLQASGPMIDVSDIRQVGMKRTASASITAEVAVPMGSSLKEISDSASAAAEKQAIVEALRTSRGNKSRAARLLKVDYKTLHVKIKRYSLEPTGV